MITKDILNKIIEENNQSVNEKRTKLFGYGPKRKSLLNYIKSLPKEDQLYLFALVDYGRDKYQMKDFTADNNLFAVKLKNSNLHKDNDYIANYLIKMGANLSSYLLYAIKILED